MVFDEFKRAKTTRFALFFLQHEVLQRCAMVNNGGVSERGVMAPKPGTREIPPSKVRWLVVLCYHGTQRS